MKHPHKCEVVLMLNIRLPNFEYNNEMQNFERCFFSSFQLNKKGENFGMKIRMN